MASRVHFSAYCAQDISLQQQIPEGELRRFHARMTTYSCGGTLKGVINHRQHVVELSIQHDRLHATPEEDGNEARHFTSQQAIDFIQHEARNGTNSSETYGRLLRESPDEFVTRPVVDYWWHQAFRAEYLHHEDQLQSCRLLLARYEIKGYAQVRVVP